MIAKACLVALAAPLVLSAASPLPAHTEEGVAPRPEIVRVQCLTSIGSAFYIGPRTLATAAHVVDEGELCRIDGKPFKVVEQAEDFAILEVAEPVAKWLTVDCSGFAPGERYTAWGYARGLRTMTTVDISARGEKIFGFSRLWGVFNVIPGQSGGPITPVDQPQTVVGTVNVYNAVMGDSGSIAFKDTSVCRNSDSARP
jgi:hypothetical protein